MYMERPPYPTTRLDVQRHHLEDQRATYAFMESNLRDERQTSISRALEAIRLLASRSLVGIGIRTRAQDPVSGAVDAAEPV